MRQKVKKSVSLLPEGEEKIILEIFNFSVHYIFSTLTYNSLSFSWAAVGSVCKHADFKFNFSEVASRDRRPKDHQYFNRTDDEWRESS